MAEGIKEIKDLADKIETTVDNNEVNKAHELLNDPIKKQEVINYLQQNEGNIAACIKENVYETAVLEARWEERPQDHPGQTENPYKGAIHLYEKLFNVTIVLGNGDMAIYENTEEKTENTVTTPATTSIETPFI